MAVGRPVMSSVVMLPDNGGCLMLMGNSRNM